MRLSAERGHDLMVRTKSFALRIIRVYASLPKNPVAQKIGKQLLRPGTSVGAQVAEANFAKSNPDFVSKLDGAIQELCETEYWLELLIEAEIVKAAKLEPLLDESKQLTAIMATVVGRTRRKTAAAAE